MKKYFFGLGVGLAYGIITAAVYHYISQYVALVLGLVAVIFSAVTTHSPEGEYRSMHTPLGTPYQEEIVPPAGPVAEGFASGIMVWIIATIIIHLLFLH